MITTRKAVRDALEKDIEVLREQKDMLIHEIEKLRKTFKDKEKGEITMKKSDLKTGMVVECRNGKKYMYIETELIHGVFICSTGYINTDFNDDFKNAYSRCYDIMKIYQANNAYQLVQQNWDDMQLVWERQEPRKMTLAEIEKELGYSVEMEESK